MRMGLIERNPVDRLPDIKQEPQKFIDVFSDEEILLLTDLSVRDGALMQLLFDAGLRKSEARNFRLAHLRVDQIVVLKGKGNKDRVLPATPDVLQKVNELVLVDGLNGKDYLWYSRPGGGSRVDRSKPIGDVSFHRWWKRCLDETGVPYRNPHVTRHTFATRYLRRGGSLSRLKRLMGHASIKTTDDLYAHLDTQDLAAEFSLLFPSRAET
jgi:integrase/recombinase XerC